MRAIRSSRLNSRRGRKLGAGDEAQTLQRRFADAGIATTVVKGVPLAILAYGAIAMREAKDLDLVVAEDRLFDAMTLLEEAGYARIDPPPSAGPAVLQARLEIGTNVGFLHPRKKIAIELHWRLCRNPSPMCDVVAVPSARSVELSPGNGLGTLGPTICLPICVCMALVMAGFASDGLPTSGR